MPTRFWGAARRARYGRFPDVVGEDDIACCFHLNLARVSPLAHRHINFLGPYAFTLPEAVTRGELRPLRVTQIPNRTFARPYVSRPFLSHAQSITAYPTDAIKEGERVWPN